MTLLNMFGRLRNSLAGDLHSSQPSTFRCNSCQPIQGRTTARCLKMSPGFHLEINSNVVGDTRNVEKFKMPVNRQLYCSDWVHECPRSRLLIPRQHRTQCTAASLSPRSNTYSLSPTVTLTAHYTQHICGHHFAKHLEGNNRNTIQRLKVLTASTKMG